jgi:hypothetical protein
VNYINNNRLNGKNAEESRHAALPGRVDLKHKKYHKNGRTNLKPPERNLEC